MKHDMIAQSSLAPVPFRVGAMSDHNLPDNCAELAIGCADIAGAAEQVAAALRRQVKSIDGLDELAEQLEIDQAQVADATEEARILSAQATRKIADSAAEISARVSRFGELTALVDRLGQQVSNFAAAIEQVNRVSAGIETIAKTTNMLALYASIEAERAGDAGRTFSVVAGEVKKLAADTRLATTEIRTTLATLSREAEELVHEVTAGSQKSAEAEQGFDAIKAALDKAIDLVCLVDEQGDVVARGAMLIHGRSQQMRDTLREHGGEVRRGSEQLIGVHAKADMLEKQANILLNGIAHSGLAIDDTRIVNLAIAYRDEIALITEQSIAAGRVDIDAIFDSDYRLIAGSNPERFTTRANDFADMYWRPLLDRISAADPAVVSTACTDMNGYLPTHMSRFSRAPTGDPVHDAAYCRNR
ncbi:MAG: methyl-accepting chemotaxis protein, partial [Sphingopyxis sp.]|nr:methyl-accepting chemotaxis protein [Sphingopyxis sp.]